MKQLIVYSTASTNKQRTGDFSEFAVSGAKCRATIKLRGEGQLNENAPTVGLPEAGLAPPKSGGLYKCHFLATVPPAGETRRNLQRAWHKKHVALGGQKKLLV